MMVLKRNIAVSDSDPKERPLTHKAITALALKLSPHVRLSKTRLEPLSLLIVAMISARTVNRRRDDHRRIGGVDRAVGVAVKDDPAHGG